GTEICGTVTVIDASKCRVYLKNFKEFYENQIKYAGTIILSRTGNISQEKLDQAIELIRAINDHSQIITTPWDDLSGVQILKAIEEPLTAADMAAALLEAEKHEHEHHHHHHDEDCECEECKGHHHHDHDDDDDDDEDEHEHHHHHDHDEDEHEHEHEHHHHHDHDADEIFDSVGFETSKHFTKDEITAALASLDENAKYGMILRSKGIVAGENGEWIHFDYVPGESEVRTGSSDVTGKIVVIGSEVKKDAVKALFGI
ncbi:MAG: GTP-binding protein, partial [Oscillospiraceae bacterium]|nr:GTP-binding protein [Oscillospiraceae bacterium]